MFRFKEYKVKFLIGFSFILAISKKHLEAFLLNLCLLPKWKHFRARYRIDKIIIVNDFRYINKCAYAQMCPRFLGFLAH